MQLTTSWWHHLQTLTLRQAVAEFWRYTESTATHSLNILLLTDEKGQQVHLRSLLSFDCHMVSYKQANVLRTQTCPNTKCFLFLMIQNTKTYLKQMAFLMSLSQALIWTASLVSITYCAWPSNWEKQEEIKCADVQCAQFSLIRIFEMGATTQDATKCKVNYNHSYE